MPYTERRVLGVAVKRNVYAICVGGFLVAAPFFAAAGEAQKAPISTVVAAAQQGDLNAQIALAVMYDRGDGVPKDPAQSFKWLLRAAQAGHAEAQFLVSDSYKHGQGVAKDETEGLVWRRKAAEGGHVPAQLALGYETSQGLGVQRNNTEAVFWFRKAAEKGNAFGQNFLGEAYALGKGASRDDREALKWYSAAAAQGLAIAQFNLGSLYANSGAQIPRDLVRAHMWLDLASKQGDGAAALTRASIAKTMSPTEVKRADALAKKCLAAKYARCGED